MGVNVDNIYIFKNAHPPGKKKKKSTKTCVIALYCITNIIPHFGSPKSYKKLRIVSMATATTTGKEQTVGGDEPLPANATDHAVNIQTFLAIPPPRRGFVATLPPCPSDGVLAALASATARSSCD